MLEDRQYHCLADAFLESVLDEVETRDKDGRVEAELENGGLGLTLPDSGVLLLSKHAPTQQIWLSSPRLGGLHFRYNQDTSRWELPDGRMLCHVLETEMKAATGLHFAFAA